MFYSFIGGLITSLIVLFLAGVDYSITNAANNNTDEKVEIIPTSSEIIINGSTIFEINEFLRVDILDVVNSISVFSIVLFGLLILIPCIILFIIGLKLAFRNRYVINKITMYILLAIWILSFMYFFYIIGIEFITTNFPYNL